MSWNSTLLSLALVAVTHTAAAAPIACPASLYDGGHRHPLNNATLYDGPAEQMASLAPDHRSNADNWSTDGVDPYLVCQYKGTEKTITLHALATRSCVAGGKPFRAYCR